MSSADIINQAKLIIYNLYLSQGMQYIWGMLMTKLWKIGIGFSKYFSNILETLTETMLKSVWEAPGLPPVE